MEWIEVNPLPQVCEECQERKECLAKGEGEWCCDECDYLGLRFVSTMSEERRKQLINRKQILRATGLNGTQPALETILEKVKELFTD